VSPIKAWEHDPEGGSFTFRAKTGLARTLLPSHISLKLRRRFLFEVLDVFRHGRSQLSITPLYHSLGLLLAIARTSEAAGRIGLPFSSSCRLGGLRRHSAIGFGSGLSQRAHHPQPLRRRLVARVQGSPKTRRKTMQMLMEPLMCLIAGVLNCRQLRAWAREKGCERKSQQPSRIVEFRKTALGRARTYNPRFRRRGSIAFLASKSEKRERTVTLKYTEKQGNLCRDTELACWPLHNFEAAEVHSHTAPKAKS
jgi:hypothetical protein